MRALPHIDEAEFDIPTETFTIGLPPGADPAAILQVIQDLGYTPLRLPGPPGRPEALVRLADPKSEALREAVRRARTRGVLLVVEVGGPFCALCARFEEVTLADAAVREALAALEYLSLDAERDATAVEDLGTRSVPDIIVFDGEGRVLARHGGYLDPEAFLVFLREASD